MILRVIGTGSKGNCYLLEADKGSLMLDAGMRWSATLNGLPNGLKNVNGCLITHEHKDHCLSALELLGRGIDCYMSEGTAKAIIQGAERPFLKGLKQPTQLPACQPLSIPPFTVMPFNTEHDAVEPYGFLIRYEPTGETIVYATDTFFVRYQFPGVHYWIIECNYTNNLAETLLETGNDALYKRLMKSHMSLERLVDLFAANDLTKTRNIVLVHLSDSRSDEDLMVKTISEATRNTTHAAHNGDVIKLGETPF